jgi:hypothetical protein
LLQSRGRCVMVGQCCLGGTVSSRLTRQLPRFTGSMLPAVFVVFLPKCPLCLAALLTVSTGVTVSATGATWLRAGALLIWIAAAWLVSWRRRAAVRSRLG